MRVSGWIFMILSWSTIIFLVVYSFYRTLKGNKS